MTPPPVCQWTVGALCWAVWAEDGREYLAEVVSVDSKCCRVRFCGYGNEQEVELSALRKPDTSASTLQGCQVPHTYTHTISTVHCILYTEPAVGSHMMRNLSVSQDWRPGSRCRAVFSEDGLVYPAVVLWVKGQHCRVRYDDYNNEEEHNVDHLLSPDELHGPSRTATNKVNKSSVRVKSECRNIRQAADLTELAPPLASPVATTIPPPLLLLVLSVCRAAGGPLEPAAAWTGGEGRRRPVDREAVQEEVEEEERGSAETISRTPG